ncbi:MAG: hypothetical protein K0S27_1303 [Gammaproteobacteria bacterium]|jgi:glycosyltransferase involved in cell wall biosynthesis|nr:hypothetical protein [Gammaproteobacteria bacterium]
MKILLITDHHSPCGGGAEKHFFTLKELLKNQSNTEVFSLGFGSEPMIGDDFIILKETSSKILRQWWRMFLNPTKYWQLRRIIKRIHPDIIHLHNIKKYTPALLKATQGYPILQTVHDFGSLCPTQWNVHQDLQPCQTGWSFRCVWQHRRNYSFIAYLALLLSFIRMKKLLKKSVTQFIAPSPLLTHYLEKNHFHPATFIFPFNVPYILTHSQPKRNHFLYLGQLEKQKGIFILLQEFYYALQKNPDLILTIAGNGSQEKILKEKARQFNIENNIHFLNWQKNPFELYENCSAIIFPSLGLESFGLVIIEAMAQARAVIGSNRGPTPWLVEHEKTGLLFDPLKKGDLATQLLKLSESPVLAETLGKNAFEKANKFPKNSEILAQIMAKYREAILLSP